MAFAIGFAIFAILRLVPTTVGATFPRFAAFLSQSVHFLAVWLVVAPVVELIAVLFFVVGPQSGVAQLTHGIVGDAEQGKHTGVDEPARKLLRGP